MFLSSVIFMLILFMWREFLKKSKKIGRENIKNINLLWRAGYTPGDRLTSWVYSTTCVQYTCL
jgi:hypothetical protein